MFNPIRESIPPKTLSTRKDKRFHTIVPTFLPKSGPQEYRVENEKKVEFSRRSRVRNVEERRTQVNQIT